MAWWKVLIVVQLYVYLRNIEALNADVRWLKYLQVYQSSIFRNTSIDSIPMCSTWLSNNYQTTPSLDRTLKNLKNWGKHCVSKFDCIRGQLSFKNHGLNITQQLDAGIRRIVLELHYVKRGKQKLRLCASIQGECKAMKKKLRVSFKKKRQFNWCKSFELTKLSSQGIHTGCHSGSPYFKTFMKDVVQWINSNQDQFIVIDLIDFASMEVGCKPFLELQDALKLFGSRIFRPSDYMITQKGTETPLMPSLDSLVNLYRKNVMFRSTCTFGGTFIFPSLKSDYKVIDTLNALQCNGTETPFSLYYHDRIHVDVNLSRTNKLKKYRSETGSSRSAYQSATRCGSQIALQAMNYQSLFDCSWTWMPHHYGKECTECTAFFLDPRTWVFGWVNTNCSRKLHLPCRSANGSYSVTGTYYNIPNKGYGHGICPGNTTFSLPLNPTEGYSLAMELWRYGLSYVWLPREAGHTCTDTVRNISCGYPGVPQNGVLTGKEFTFDSTVEYKCRVGWNLHGTSTRLCMSTGSWTGYLPTCKKVDCGEPPRPQLAKRYGSSTSYGEKFGYTCRWGHVFNGNAGRAYIVTTCGADGKWSIDVPDCVRKTCEVSQWSKWSECSVTCGEGKQARTRQIVSHTNHINGDCPSLEETRSCNPRRCDTCKTESYDLIVEADTCRSAERVTIRYCKGDCKSGVNTCCRPIVKSIKKVMLFCEDSRPRNYNLPIIDECGCVTCG